MVKKEKSEQPEVVEAEVVGEDTTRPSETRRERAGIGSGQIIWGLILVFFGVMLLLGNLGLVDVKWSSIWQLWPLLIILAGVATLDIKGWAGILVTLVTIGFSAGLVFVVLTGAIDKVVDTDGSSGGESGVRESVNTSRVEIGSSRSVERAEIEVEFGGGSVNVNDHQGDDTVRGELKSASHQLNSKTTIEDGVQEINLSIDRRNEGWNVSRGNDLNLTLARDLPVDLEVDAGAAGVKLDLERIMARIVDIDTGASSVWMKLGSKQAKVDVNIDTGVSSVEIEVPKEAGVRLKLDSGLSSRNLPSDLEKVDDSTYQSKGFEDSKVQFNINIDIGLSSLDIKRY